MPSLPDLTPERIARSLNKGERKCIANWGDGKTPIPDSIWHGSYSHLKRHAPGSSTRFVLSPLGLSVKQYLETQHD